MEDQVPFKVYTFWRENDKPEVRRFGIEKSVVTSFHYLNAKLQDVYPGLKGRTYSVAWKDEDGDDVVVSSDDEVMTALQALNGDIIKLFVYCKGDEVKDDDCDIVFTAVAGTPNEPVGTPAVHYGVMCDSCDGTIVGFRYKCSVCDDFDLCSRCEAAGRHPEHCMVRVPTPTMPRTVIKAAIKRSRHFLKSVATAMGEDCPYKKHRSERSGERKHRGPGGHHGPHGAENGPHGEHHRRRQRVSWLDTFATYMNEFANLAGDIDLTGDDTKPKAPEAKAPAPAQAPETQAQNPPETSEKAQTATESTQAPKAEPSTSTNAGTQCQFSPPKRNVIEFKDILDQTYKTYGLTRPSTNTESQSHSSPPKFGNVNELKDLLEQFIKANQMTSTSINTETQCTFSPSNTNKVLEIRNSLDQFFKAHRTANGAAFTPASADDAEMGQGDRKVPEADDATVKTGSSSASSVNDFGRDTSPDKVDDWTMINKEKDLMDTASALPAAPIGFNLPEEFQDRVKISAGGLYPPLNTSTAEPEVSKPAQPSAPPASAAPTPKPAEKPAAAKPQPQPQPQPQPRQRHPQAHIDAAIQQMLAMGFTNEGGWLTQLLESKDGNIAAVLDLLTPVNPKK